MKKSGHFRFTQWDPFLLCSQIVAVQSLMYLTLCIFMAIMEDLTGSSRTLDHVFKYNEIHIRNSEGRSVIIAYIFTSLVGASILSLVVGRTKLCLDFSCTYHLIHLIACWIHNGWFPNTLSWWLLNIVCGCLTCIGGEFLSLKQEMRAIPLGGKVDL